jgi:3-dehydroquinate synthase
MLGEAEWRRILGLLRALTLSVYAPELDSALDDAEHPRSLLRGLDEFREHLGGELTVMMLRGIGKPADVHTIDAPLMVRAIRLLADVARHSLPVAALASGDSEMTR